MHMHELRVIICDIWDLMHLKTQKPYILFFVLLAFHLHIVSLSFPHLSYGIFGTMVFLWWKPQFFLHDPGWCLVGLEDKELEYFL